MPQHTLLGPCHCRLPVATPNAPCTPLFRPGADAPFISVPAVIRLDRALHYYYYPSIAVPPHALLLLHSPSSAAAAVPLHAPLPLPVSRTAVPQHATTTTRPECSRATARATTTTPSSIAVPARATTTTTTRIEYRRAAARTTRLECSRASARAEPPRSTRLRLDRRSRRSAPTHHEVSACHLSGGHTHAQQCVSDWYDYAATTNVVVARIAHSLHKSTTRPDLKHTGSCPPPQSFAFVLPQIYHSARPSSPPPQYRKSTTRPDPRVRLRSHLPQIYHLARLRVLYTNSSPPPQ